MLQSLIPCTTRMTMCLWELPPVVARPSVQSLPFCACFQPCPTVAASTSLPTLLWLKRSAPPAQCAGPGWMVKCKEKEGKGDVLAINYCSKRNSNSCDRTLPKSHKCPCLENNVQWQRREACAYEDIATITFESR